MATKNAGLGRKKLVIKINFHRFSPIVFDYSTSNSFSWKSKYHNFSSMRYQLPFHTQPSDAKKKKIGCTF